MPSRDADELFLETVDDGELEDIAFRYIWISLNSPNKMAKMIGWITAEAGKRGRPDIVERAREKAQRTGVAKEAESATG